MDEYDDNGDDDNMVHHDAAYYVTALSAGIQYVSGVAAPVHIRCGGDLASEHSIVRDSLCVEEEIMRSANTAAAAAAAASTNAHAHTQTQASSSRQVCM